MDRTIKLLAASSVVMLTMTACAPGYSPYGSSGTGSTYDAGSSGGYGGGGATKEAVTHSHGGKVHSHALPSTGLRHTHTTGGGYSSGGYTGGGYTGGGGGGTTYVPPRNPNPYPQQYNPGNNNGGVPHSHCGRVHSHPLPPQGLAHTHGNPACPAGAASGGNAGNNGQYTNQQQGGGNQQQGNNSGYDYAYGGNVNNGGGSTYDYSGQTGNGNTGNGTNNNSYYNYGEVGSGTNNNNANYYDSTQPKAPSNYYDNNSNTNYDYSSPNSNGVNNNTDPYANSGSSGGSFAPNNYSGGNTYIVKRGDTVFQVMRNTGVYWKDIIRLNNLQAPNYQINPGQSLRLK